MGFYTGTVRDGNLLLLVRNFPTGELQTTAPEVAIFPPGTAPDASAWRAPGLQYSGPALAVSLTHASVVVQVGYGMLSLAVDAPDVTVIGSTDALVYLRGLPRHPVPPDPAALQAYQAQQVAAYTSQAPGSLTFQILDEWFFELPLACAAMLSESGFHQEAADWLQTVYSPYRPTPAERLIWRGFTRAVAGTGTLQDTLAWLRDPFNPHAIAAAREGAQLRRTLLATVENLLDWADRLFITDTSESVDRARGLYQLALELLGYDELAGDDCLRRLRHVLRLARTSLAPTERRVVETTLGTLATLHDAGIVRAALDDVERIVSHDGAADGAAVAMVERVREAAAADDLARTVSTAPELRERREALLARGERLIAADDTSLDWFTTAAAATVNLEEVEAGVALLAPSDFCTPPNPLLELNRFRAESNLEKIRSCRNFAGLKRGLQAYAPAADPGSMAAQAASRQEADALVESEPPPIYRYQYLHGRAQNFLTTAQQLSAQMLAAIEKQEEAQYNVLRAQQEAELAKSSIALQGLRVKEALDSITLAQLQKDRVVVQRDYYQELLDGGWSSWETAAVVLMTLSGVAHAAAAIAAGIDPRANAATVLSETAAALGTGASIAQTVAGFERREREWRYQRDLARKDVSISDQHIALANDHHAIMLQERDIAQLQGEHADDVVNFTNKELYAWMAGTLRRSNREHMNFAVTLARMAQQALSFERQEPINVVGSGAQYWDAERKGILAAELLMLDLARLDQHRLSTGQRKRELTKTISLAAVAPVELQALRETGAMEVTTLLEWFDRDFPGHYLRLVKSVAVSLDALVPPADAIHATLRNSGLSRWSPDRRSPSPRCWSGSPKPSRSRRRYRQRASSS
jgi:hypothetical protein